MIAGTLWRQGDVLIQRVEAIPPSARKLKRPVLASGDKTGHRHQIKDRRSARLLSVGEGRAMQLFLEVWHDDRNLVAAG